MSAYIQRIFLIKILVRLPQPPFFGLRLSVQDECNCPKDF